MPAQRREKGAAQDVVEGVVVASFLSPAECSYSSKVAAVV